MTILAKTAEDAEEEGEDKCKECATSDVGMRLNLRKYVIHHDRVWSRLLADKHVFDSKAQELMLMGHLRGKAPFNVNALIPFPHQPDFVSLQADGESETIVCERSTGKVYAQSQFRWYDCEQLGRCKLARCHQQQVAGRILAAEKFTLQC